jgi:hypothetical protein
VVVELYGVVVSIAVAVLVAEVVVVIFLVVVVVVVEVVVVMVVVFPIPGHLAPNYYSYSQLLIVTNNYTMFHKKQRVACEEIMMRINKN